MTDDSDVVPPWASRYQLQQWAADYDQRIARGEVSTHALVEVLADARRSARDMGWIADWLLFRARQHGATLPPLAAAWSTSGRRELVRGPDARLKRLEDRFGVPEGVLDAFLQLPATAPQEASMRPERSALTDDDIPACLDPAVADQRSWDLVGDLYQRDGSGHAYWATRAQHVLRCYLLAAALTGAQARDIWRWASTPDAPEPLTVLTSHTQDVPEGWGDALEVVAQHDTELNRHRLAVTIHTALGPPPAP